MKAKLLSVLIVILSSFAFSSCAEEEIKPTQVTDEAQAQGLGEDDPDF
ncbi:MAG: hypothetical protein WD555_01175 [Fulvivirga sp.]